MKCALCGRELSGSMDGTVFCYASGCAREWNESTEKRRVDALTKAAVADFVTRRKAERSNGS